MVEGSVRFISVGGSLTNPSGPERPTVAVSTTPPKRDSVLRGIVPRVIFQVPEMPYRTIPGSTWPTRTTLVRKETLNLANEPGKVARLILTRTRSPRSHVVVTGDKS